MSNSERSMDGFEPVFGRRNEIVNHQGVEREADLSQKVVVTFSKEKIKGKSNLGLGPRVPFHIPFIRRPQDVYNIVVNNVNQPFDHVWLDKSEDGSTFIHPLEKLSVLGFVDKNVGVLKPIKPPSMGKTPFKLIQEVKDLRELAATLRGVDEFAVDLENNQYRSFQGLTCLMQISTRTEDFIIDTLKLHIHIGPYLREIFKDPRKKKVMHGADNDILWLQRDFGIYICNLFDTGQASRVLKLERNSLEYLLCHFCQVSANKEYQNADWRLRPLPDEMLRYAREDTHYLLYVYDLLKVELTKMQHAPEKVDDALLEAYERSYDLCMQLYEKELQTENSFLHIYGLRCLNFNAKQLAIVAGLCEWRDVVARAEDESTGYVLPNKALLEIAKEIPVTVCKLQQLLKSKHPYVEQNIGSVFSIMFHAMQNSAAFEAVAEQLTRGVHDVVEEEWIPAQVVEDTSVSPNAEIENLTIGSDEVSISVNRGATPNFEQKRTDCVINTYAEYEHRVLHGNDGNKIRSYGCASKITIAPISSGTETVETTSGHSAELIATTIQVPKRPSDASDAVLGACVEMDNMKILRDHDGPARPSEAAGGVVSGEIIALEDETRNNITNVDEFKVSADADQISNEKIRDAEDLTNITSVMACSEHPNNPKEPSILNLKTFDYVDGSSQIQCGGSGRGRS